MTRCVASWFRPLGSSSNSSLFSPPQRGFYVPPHPMENINRHKNPEDHIRSPGNSSFQFSEAFIKQPLHFSILTEECVHTGIQHFLSRCVTEINSIMIVEGKFPDKLPLTSSVSLPERMKCINFRKVIG